MRSTVKWGDFHCKKQQGSWLPDKHKVMRAELLGSVERGIVTVALARADGMSVCGKAVGGLSLLGD